MFRPSLLCSAIGLLLCLGASAQTAEVLLEQAKSAQRSGDLNGAITSYRKALELQPKSVPAWINLGAALSQSGRFDEAIASYQTALKLDAGNRQARFFLGLAYFKQGDAANAAVNFEQVLKTNPRDVRTATLLGASYLQTGANERALATLEPLAGAAAEDADFLWSYGSALISNGRLRAGVEAVEKVARRNNSPEAWMLAGQNLLTLNEFERARADLENAARINGSLPGVQTALGQAREKNADYQGAIEAFSKGADQNPNDFDALLGLGSDRYFVRDLEKARPALTRALAIDPSSAPALYALALVDKAQGNREAAVSELEKAVKIRPDWMEAHVQLAALYVQLNRAADGARERAIVDRISEQQRQAGPGKP